MPQNKLMTVSKKKKLHGRGGPGRGQGNKPIENKRIQVSVNVPPAMLGKIKACQEITGDTFSSTIVWLIDHGLKITDNFD